MQTYTVKSGDTLGKIAKKFYSDAARFSLIVAANHIGNPDRLAVGAQLMIPDVGAPTIPTAPSLSSGANIDPEPQWPNYTIERTALRTIVSERCHTRPRHG